MIIDWLGAALEILKVAKRNKLRIDPELIVIKPRILSDENYLKAISGLKVALAFAPVPGAAIASPILGLGQMGFKLWKRMALGKEYDQLKFPPIDPNMLRIDLMIDVELNKHYKHLLTEETWTEETVQKMEEIYNDLSFITNVEILKVKYSNLDPTYLQKRADANLDRLQENLEKIETEFVKASHKANIDYNVKEAFGSLQKLFPAMNDWALFNSKGFNDVMEIIDTIF